jgi:hypothetical protein
MNRTFGFGPAAWDPVAVWKDKMIARATRRPAAIPNGNTLIDGSS